MVENSWVPFLENGLELREKKYTVSLLALRGVTQYNFVFNNSQPFSRKGTQEFRRSVCHRMNVLPLVPRGRVCRCTQPVAHAGRAAAEDRGFLQVVHIRLVRVPGKFVVKMSLRVIDPIALKQHCGLV